MRRPTVLMAHPSCELYGSDRMFLEAVQAVGDAGFRTVVTLPRDGPLAAELRARGVQVVLCPAPVLRKAALRPAGLIGLVGQTLGALVPMVRLLRDARPDAVYINTVTLPAWLLLARIRGLRSIAHVHEAEDAVPAPVRFALTAPLLAAHRVIAISRATEYALLRSQPLLRGRISLIYNGVAGPEQATVDSEPTGDTEPTGDSEPTGDTEPTGNRDLRPTGPARLLVVGRLSPRKGTDVAVDAVALLHAAGREVHLRLMGSVFAGYEWYEQHLRDRIDALGIRARVRLDPFDPDVWAAYGTADIALVPSRQEPFGNAAVEAQLAGVPVIVSDAQGLPETVGGGAYGAIVPAGDPAALATAVARMLAYPEPSVRRAQRAREHARTRFAPARFHARISEVVAAEIGRSAAP